MPDSARVGDVDAGWGVMHAALVYERTSANWGEPNHLVESVAAWALEPGDDGIAAVRRSRGRGRPWPGPPRSWRWAGSCCSGPPGSSRGEMPQVEGSMAKLHITEAFVRASSELLDLLGTRRPARRRRARRRSLGPRGARLPACGRHHDLRRLQRGAAGDHRRPGPRPAQEPVALRSSQNLTHGVPLGARLLSCATNHKAECCDLGCGSWLASGHRTPAAVRPAAGAQCSADHPHPLRRAPRPRPPHPGGPPP